MALTNYTTPNWKIKEIHKIMKDLNVMNFIHPDSFKNDSQDLLLLCLHNPNMYLLIIESMCLGIIMTDHLAENFAYIRGLKKYHTFIKYKKYNIKVLKINSHWDTSNWNSDKLERFHSDMTHYILGNQIEDIKQLDSWILEKLDIRFLEALSWGTIR